ncbi:hypothetical protein [Herbaspirillum autotrophicum]|uniref:hypothetical protein n=1 Tax=Herbaspirillum autotrophicum TaxID=180195 RepID=UPI000A7D2DE9|nr:hypothetical protein [Herbaspirillum autotrophicum]
MQSFFSDVKRRRGVRLLSRIAVMAAVCAVQSVSAQMTVTSKALIERFPPGTAYTVESADEALTATTQARQAVEMAYEDEQRRCYKRFFVSSCLEDATDVRRVELKQIRQVEMEANLFKRQHQADERDKALAEQRTVDQADAKRRAQEQQEKAAAAQKKVAESQAKAKEVQEREAQTAGKGDYRVKQHEAEVRARRAEEAAKAPERAANEAAYKAKVKEAEAHRLEVEQKKAEKERERAAKQAPAAVTPPAAAPAPGTAR